MTYLVPGFDLTKEEFQNGRRINNDGSGFAYAKDGELFMEKGFMSFDEFYEAYSAIGTDVPRVVHHRMGWGGGKNKDNCHPFMVNENLCVAHNGMLSSHTANANQSDTNIFNETILKPLFANDFEMIQKPYIKFLVSEAIGSNKLIFLDKNGVATIINPKLGDWDKSENGAWYSSMAHTTKPYVAPACNNHHTTHYGKPATDYYSNGVSDSGVKNNDNETYQEWLKRHYVEYVDSQKKSSNVPKEQLCLPA